MPERERARPSAPKGLNVPLGPTHCLCFCFDVHSRLCASRSALTVYLPVCGLVLRVTLSSCPNSVGLHAASGHSEVSDFVSLQSSERKEGKEEKGQTGRKKGRKDNSSTYL